MRPITYTRQEVQALVPLLRSIAREVRERSQAIEVLEARWQRREARAEPGLERDRPMFVAVLAQQRRELRDVEKELARLGCQIDPDHGLRILIPGKSGRMTGGYAWDARADRLEPLTSTSAS